MKALAIYLPIAALFLCLQALQGLSYLDIGMYMSGYEHFAEEPAVTAYLGQWIATYLFTGQLITKLLPHSFLSLRLLHIVLFLGLQTTVFLWLRNLFNKKLLIVGMALTTLSHFGSYLDINYNDYSTTLLTLAILVLHRAVFSRKNAALLFALSGGLAGTAVFFRVVNVSFLLLPFVTVPLCKLCRAEVNSSKLFAGFGIGYLAGMMLMSCYLWQQGAWPVWMLTLSDLTAIGTDGEDPHSQKAVVVGVYTTYKTFFTQACVFLAFLFLLTQSIARLQRTWKVMSCTLLALLFIVNLYLWEPAAGVVGGICVIAFSSLFMGNRISPRSDLLLSLSLIVPLVYPIGSNGGLDFFGQSLFTLALPVGIVYIAHIPTLISKPWQQSYPHALRLIFISLGAALLLTNVKRPMMEEGNRLDCFHSINNPRTEHILTTAHNATLHNHLLSELSPIVPKGSYLVCNFSLPLISMLECKPYAVFSDVFTSTKMNQHYINIAHQTLANQTPAAPAEKLFPWMLIDREQLSEGFGHVVEELNSRCAYKTVWTDGRYELQRPYTKKRQRLF